MTFIDEGCFRYRLVCATLSGQSVRLEDVRTNTASPGLLEEEIAFLHLLNAISHGCVVEINSEGNRDPTLFNCIASGTQCLYKPGLITGGAVDCPVNVKRNLSYFLEPLSLSIVMEGITNDSVDPSVDVLRTVMLPIVAKFCEIDSGLELKIIKRGAAPLGGGKVVLISFFNSIIEGFRMVESARGLLNPYLSDVHIFTDAVRGKDSGNSPGYGLYLVAETTTGCLLSTESYGDKTVDGMVSPEETGSVAAALLLEEISHGGVVDGWHQRIAVFLCAMGPALISRIRLGPLVPQTVEMLRLLKDVFGVMFDIRPDREHGTVFLSCIGIGVKNAARRAA